VTRRITGALAVMALLVVTVVIVPLGILAGRTDREAFRSDTLADARAMATALAARPPTGQAGYAWDEWARPGDRVVVVAPDGRPLPGPYGEGALTAADASLVRRAMAGQAATRWGHDQLVVAAPVADWGGAVVLVRPSERLDARVGGRWLLLVGIGLFAVAGAVGTAWWAGRRLGGPVAELQASVEAFGAGDLSARAGPVHGPEEVRALAEEFNRTASRLDQLVRGHRALLADVAHQLRTPLAALRLHLELAAQDAPGADDEIGAALGEVGRLSRLLDGLLAAARAESGSGARAEVDVDEVVAGRVGLWAPLAEEKGARLETPAVPAGSDGSAAPARRACRVRAGAGHLEQVVDNLLANALDAGATCVQIGVARRDGRVRLQVADDGPGLSPARRDAVVHRYTGDRPGGTGLGLAIVDRLVTADGGTLSLDDTPGGGLTVTVELPAAG
jgi:signal transduction histidine kinase